MIDYIKSTKPKNSFDINGINTKLLHFVAEQIAIPMCHIFNLSLETGIFPDKFKMSKTCPIFKKGDQMDPSNYRGVSLIDNLSKVFEKILAFKIKDFLDSNNFFYKHQYGFRPKRNTNQALLDILNDITKEINNDRPTLAVFFDVAKAFDAVPHDILFSKLFHYGIRDKALDLIKSYFSGRQQKVSVNGTFSENICDILLGVLQGSVLGVLLFIIYINDLPNASSPNCKNVIFADDNTSLISGNSIHDLLIKANYEINNLLDWYSANKLAIHPDKCRAMVFQPGYRTINNEDFPLYLDYNEPGNFDMNNYKLIKLIPNEDESSFKLLGVLIDHKLNLKDHVKHVHSKVSKSNFAINQMKNYLDKPHLRMLSNAYVRSHVDYCTNLLTNCAESTLKPLNVALKKSIRIVTGAGRFDHTAPLYKAENILPLHKNIEFNALVFMHSYKYDYCPNSFTETCNIKWLNSTCAEMCEPRCKTWSTNREISQRENRNADDYYANQFNYATLKNLPFFKFPELWNNFDEDIKNIECKILFKKKAKQFLLDSITNPNDNENQNQ
eukprot:TRINITY_DN6784_c0_g1_i3.p1 TRINITY_DN6784_c0_g1~~TRINITY_DN6784_c0_g1_i3.p1  ORF type:complete len:611 (-),score=-4.06 TRINITY_DN6784_c0_g1_i3:608-2272(-)